MAKTENDAILEAQPAPGGFIDFDGQNCAGPCEGWDGMSRRCECGNRRVSFTTSKDADGNWSAYAEAY